MAAEAGGGDPRPSACPHCGSAEVERLSVYGSQLMTSQYRCRSCGTIFEWIRWGEDGPAGDSVPGRP